MCLWVCKVDHDVIFVLWIVDNEYLWLEVIYEFALCDFESMDMWILRSELLYLIWRMLFACVDFYLWPCVIFDLRVFTPVKKVCIRDKPLFWLPNHSFSPFVTEHLQTCGWSLSLDKIIVYHKSCSSLTLYSVKQMLSAKQQNVV